MAILAEDALNEERLSLLKALKVDIVRTPSHNAQNPESLNSPESVGKKLAEETRNSMVLEICSGSGSDDLVSEAMREMVAGIVGEIDASSITHIVFPDDSPSSSATPQLLFQKFLAEKLGQSCQLVSSQLAVSDHHGADHHQNDINFVSKKQAHQTTRDVISSSGILCGLRSGAAITVARRLVEADPSLAGGKIICILDDPASHYQSTLLK